MKIVYQVDSAGREIYYKLSTTGKRTRIAKGKLSDPQLNSAELMGTGSNTRRVRSETSTRSKPRKNRKNRKSASRNRSGTKSPGRKSQIKPEAQTVIEEISENVAEKTIEDIGNGSLPKVNEENINKLVNINTQEEVDALLENKSESWLREFARKLGLNYNNMTLDELIFALRLILFYLVGRQIGEILRDFTDAYYPYLGQLGLGASGQHLVDVFLSSYS